MFLPRCCSYCCRTFMKKQNYVKRRFQTIPLQQNGHISQSLVRMSSSAGKQVIVSQSEDIYLNLALEDWLYEKADLTNQSILLMWRNEPAIVIGRHQIPWLECNIPLVKKQGVSLARRKSGGGTVYHDRGNLNCSVLTNRKAYNRKENLELIVRAIQSKWDIPLTVNSRDDIMLDGLYKISGTAAKLGGKRAYHHFTLLFDADLAVIPSLLDSPMIGGDTRATASVPAPVRNLTEVDDRVDFESLTSAITHEFLQGQVHENCIRYISPIDSVFPGLEAKLEGLRDPEWIFGKSPKFTLLRDFVLLPANGNHRNHEGLSLKIDVLINKGRIEDAQFSTSGFWDSQELQSLHVIQECLKGKVLSHKTVVDCLSNVDCEIVPEKERTLLWIKDCVKGVFNFC